MTTQKQRYANKDAFEEALQNVDPYFDLKRNQSNQSWSYPYEDNQVNDFFTIWNAAIQHTNLKTTVTTEQIQEVFDYWQAVMNKQKSRLTPERRKKIRSRLVFYTTQEIKQAIDGCKNTPHNMGVNDRNTLYNDIELICRNDTNLERFRDTQPIQQAQTESISDMVNSINQQRVDPDQGNDCIEGEYLRLK
jgi:hypothetical protein